MTSKGHKCKQMWSEAAQSTGLHIDVVKEWIGNRRRRENLPSKKQEIKKKHYARGISAFNAFVSEHKDQLGSLGGEWASAWNGKSQEEKESYRQKAIKLNQESNGPQKTKRQLLNSIHTDMLQLARHGVTMACLGVDGIDQSTIFIGSGKAEQYFQDKNDILEKLHRFCVEDTPVLSVEQENTKSLRKRAMEHLNSLFGSAVGHPHPFPYKRVFAGEVVVKGLPEEILPLRFMSHYGEQKLKAVLACAKIEVSFPSETNTGEPGTSASDAIEEEIGEGVTLHKVSSEEADVLMPLFPEEQKTEAGTKKRGKKRKSNANTEDYIVERILSMKTTKGKRFYLIKWNGYPDSENSWEPEDNIPNNVIHYFL